MALTEGFLVYFTAKMSCGAVMAFSTAYLLFGAEHHFRIFHTRQVSFDNMFDMHQGGRRNIGSEVGAVTNGFHLSWFVSGFDFWSRIAKSAVTPTVQAMSRTAWAPRLGALTRSRRVSRAR